MNSKIIRLLLLLFFATSCTVTAAPPNLEATVQAAVQATLSSPLRATPTRAQEFTVQDKLGSLCWVAYSPTHFNPNTGVAPSEADLRQDLQTLFQARFRGVATYGASGIFSKIPQIAREVGFTGVIMGVWSPTDAAEIANAQNAAAYVDGYTVGNEGLYFKRYDLNTLKTSMDALRTATNKPVTTTDVLSLYLSDVNLRNAGDWAFPTAHPYWSGIKEPVAAAAWTRQQFANLSQLYAGTPKTIAFKEVGLPTAGDPAVSEAVQAEYYQILSNAKLPFLYFEAFDQPWKNDKPVEPYWGVFKSDRSPKPVIQNACLKSAAVLPMILQ